MSIIIKNLNKIVPESNPDSSNNSFFSKGSNYPSSNSKIVLKENNYSDINISRNKKKARSIYSKLKMEQIHNFKKNKARNSTNLNRKNINPSHFSNNKTPKHCSMKTLEKSIQQKILDISMKIEEESVLLKEKTNKINLSLFIKQKLGREESNYNNSSSTMKDIIDIKRNKNKTFIEKKINLDISPKIDDNNKMRKHPSCIFFSKLKKKTKKEKFRVLTKKKIVYDSFDSEEVEELEQFFISPNNKIILIIDSLIIISTIFNIIYTPFYLSNIQCFCSPIINIINYIYYFIDLLFIIDVLLGFFRAYHNFQFQLITNSIHIIKHYLISQFIFDLIQAIPFFSYMSFICHKKSNDVYICTKFNMKKNHMLLLLCCMLKQLKIFKIINIKKNSAYYKIKIFFSKSDWTEQLFNFFIYIFIGHHSYPNWITKSNSQNANIQSLYLISFYYLITTMTTVGYGDIVCGSFNEIIFQIILLSAGIIVYSFIVSSIGNYVKNESHASMKFDKDEGILEEISISEYAF